MDLIRSTEDALRIIERFEALPVERRLEIFRHLSARAREELVQTLKKPHDIISRISEEEMFFTIKELGGENAPGLVHATTDRQLQYILDVDLWKKDVFIPSAAIHWMDIIARMGEGKILQFMRIADTELIPLVLSRFIRVEIRNPEIDLAEQRDLLPSFSLDNAFFIEFLHPNTEDTIKEFLEGTFRWNPEFYFSLMQEVAEGDHLENEQIALKWRQARLADHGLPDFDEAFEVYQYTKPTSMAPCPEGSLGTVYEPDAEMPLLQYPLKEIHPESLLHKCLDTIGDPEEKDQFSMALARLANKVLIADAGDPGSLSEILGALKKVSGYINIALQEACGTDVSAAVDLLRAAHAETLFRRGFSMVLDLQREAFQLAVGCGGGIEELGYPLTELIEGLLKKRPVYAAQMVGEPGPRDFQSQEEVYFVRHHLRTATDQDRWEPL
jgi:hypothetical protein